MKINLKPLYTFAFLTMLSLQICTAQDHSGKKEIYNEDFKWTITIPEGFESVTAEEWGKMQDKGKDAIEDVYEGEVENNAKTIFALKNDEFNYFESNYQPFDSATDGNYLETFAGVNEILYNTFKAQIPGAEFDSSSSSEKISGLTFYTFNVTIHYREMTMEYKMFSRLFEKREFTVNILTTDKDKQKALLKAWRKSKFKKE